MAVLAREEGLRQYPLFVDYGQLAAEREWNACRRVFRRMRLPAPARLDLSSYGSFIKSGITTRRRNIVRDAFLPGRNSLLLLAGAAYARQRKCEAVCIGLLDDSRHLFPDQTREFLSRVQGVLPDSVAYPVAIRSPLMNFSKQAVIRLAQKHGIDGTYSCHRGGKEPCGRCISCAEFEL